jgi:hypothetical protein
MERATPMQFILERIMQKRKVEMRALGENGGGGPTLRLAVGEGRGA